MGNRAALNRLLSRDQGRILVVLNQLHHRQQALGLRTGGVGAAHRFEDLTGPASTSADCTRYVAFRI